MMQEYPKALQRGTEEEVCFDAASEKALRAEGFSFWSDKPIAGPQEDSPPSTLPPSADPAPDAPKRGRPRKAVD